MNNDILLTSAQVATQLGMTDSQLRTLKSRNKNQLIEGTHWINENGRNLWTVQGVTVLKELCNGSVSSCNGSVTECNAIDSQLQPMAEAIALQVIEQRLPILVEREIARILANPTDVDNDRITQMLDRVGAQLGLIKAASLLASGLRVAVEASKESLKSLPGGHN